MDLLYKLFGILHRLIWSIIGIIILAGIIIVFRNGPRDILKNVISALVPSSTLNGNPSSPGQPQAPSFTLEQTTCLKQALGEARFNELTSTGGRPPTKEKQTQLNTCLGNPTR